MHGNTKIFQEVFVFFSVLTMDSSITQINYPLFRIFHHPHIRSISDGLYLPWTWHVVCYYVKRSQGQGNRVGSHIAAQALTLKEHSVVTHNQC